MQTCKRGNGHRKRKRRNRSGVHLQTPQLMEIVRLTFHRSDPITGQEDALSSLFYEFYRGYTIYSNSLGRCCIHGNQGCLRIQGQYACFPDVEQAKRMIKYFLASEYTSDACMDRALPKNAYQCLNAPYVQRPERPRSDLTTRKFLKQLEVHA